MDLFKKNPSAQQIAQQLIQRKEVAPLVVTQTEREHKHEWELLSKTIVAPRRDIPVNGLEKDLADKILFGATVFLWECLICKALRKESVLGTDLPPLDEMLDKATQYGPQYIQRADGTTFVLTEWKQQTNGVLPLR